MDLSQDHEPNASAAEAAVLGALLGDINQAEAIKYVTELEPADFFEAKHRDIYSALVEIVKSGAMPDLVLTCEKSGCDPVYLVQMRSLACMPSQIPHYLPLLHKARRGRLIKTCISQAEAALAQSDDYEQVENHIIDTLTKSRQAKDKIVPVNEGFDIGRVLAGQDTINKIPTGIDDLDAALGGGIQCGEVCVLAADTSTGKSAAGIKIALSALVASWPVQYESYEMKRQEIWQRSLSYWSDVSITRFRDRTFGIYDSTALKRAAAEMEPLWKWFTANTKSTTPGELMSLARLQRMKTGTFLLIVDTAQRMRVDGKKSKYERASEIIHGLKDIALQCEIPILVMWQLSRPDKATKPAQRKPQLCDLRDTGEAEEVADIVILCSRDSYYDRKIPIEAAMMTFDVAKGRDGCKLVKVEVPWLRLISRNWRGREPGED